jgi:hypothetical protein
MINREEFDQKIKENKWFEDPQELVDYRFPIVEFYIKYLFNMKSIVMQADGKAYELLSSDIILNKPDINHIGNFTALNIIYNYILNTYGKHKEDK